MTLSSWEAVAEETCCPLPSTKGLNIRSQAINPNIQKWTQLAVEGFVGVSWKPAFLRSLGNWFSSPKRSHFSLPLTERTYGYLTHLSVYGSSCWPQSPSESQVAITYSNVHAGIVALPFPQQLVLFIICLIYPPLLCLYFHSCSSRSPHSLSISCYPLALSICSVLSLSLAVSCCPHYSLLLSHFPTADHVQSVSLSLCSGLF